MIVCRFIFIAVMAIAPHLVCAEQAHVTVWTKGSTRSARALFKPGSGVKVLGAEEEQQRYREGGVLPVEERNALFRKIGVEPQVAQMDDLDKDMLIMAAREYNLRELRSDYPMFSEQQLKRLKSEVGKMP